MDYNSWTFTVFLYSLWRYAAGQALQSPSNVTVVLQDGEATLVWVPPAWAPFGAYYKVELAVYDRTINWTTVPGCEQLRSSDCDLTDFTTFKDLYRARVQVVKDQTTSKWSRSKRFCRKDGELLPPTFTLSANSTSLKIRVHRKAVLKAVYSHGLRYTYHLQEKGQDNMVNRSVLWVGDEEEEEKDFEFPYLTWGREYCVRLEVKHEAGIATSEASSDQCILLPQPEWYIPALMLVVCLSVLVMLGLLTLLLHCFLWQHKTLPSTLKCPSSTWSPLILGEVPVEKVTDQGWFLVKQMKSGEFGEKRKAMEDEEGEAWRDSMDSGVSVERPPSQKGGGGEGDRGERPKQEDSGCGSLGETDCNSSGSRRTPEEHTLLDGRNHGRDPAQKEDSGLSLGCEIRYSESGILQGVNCGHLHVEGVATGGGYRSQRPFFVVSQGFETENPREGSTAESDISTEIAVGYRPSQFSCVCLGKGLCLCCQSLTLSPLKNSQCAAIPQLTTVTSSLHPQSSVSQTATSERAILTMGEI